MMEACGGAAGLGRLCGAGEALRTMEGVRIISGAGIVIARPGSPTHSTFKSAGESD